MSDDSPFDQHFGRPRHAPLEAFPTRPERFRSWQAVLLGCGGGDGYWMRLLGNTDCVYHRVGALVISADAISYGEIVARRRQQEYSEARAPPANLLSPAELADTARKTLNAAQG